MKRHPALKAVKKKRKQCKRLVAKKGEAASRQAMTSNFARTHTCARVLFAVDSLPVAGHAESRDPRQGQISQAARARVPNCRSSVSVSLYLSLLHKTAAPATTTKKKKRNNERRRRHRRAPSLPSCDGRSKGIRRKPFALPGRTNKKKEKPGRLASPRDSGASAGRIHAGRRMVFY